MKFGIFFVLLILGTFESEKIITLLHLTGYVEASLMTSSDVLHGTGVISRMLLTLSALRQSSSSTLLV